MKNYQLWKIDRSISREFYAWESKQLSLLDIQEAEGVRAVTFIAAWNDGCKEQGSRDHSV